MLAQQVPLLTEPSPQPHDFKKGTGENRFRCVCLVSFLSRNRVQVCVWFFACCSPCFQSLWFQLILTSVPWALASTDVTQELQLEGIRLDVVISRVMVHGS